MKNQNVPPDGPQITVRITNGLPPRDPNTSISVVLPFESYAHLLSDKPLRRPAYKPTPEKTQKKKGRRRKA